MVAEKEKEGVEKEVRTTPTTRSRPSLHHRYSSCVFFRFFFAKRNREGRQQSRDWSGQLVISCAAGGLKPSSEEETEIEKEKKN